MKKKSFALILIFVIVSALAILAAAIISRTISEKHIAQTNLEVTQTFWLAEAGANRALKELKGDFSTAAAQAKWSGTLSVGQYLVDLSPLSGSSRTITAHGFIPSITSPRIERKIEVTVTQPNPPSNFFNNAVYASNNVSGGSSANSKVTGNVIFGGSNSYPTNKISGTATGDPTINPLAVLDFAKLREISRGQNNYHNATNNPPYPATFWNVAPAQGTPGIPNVVFVEADFDLGGSETRGGFIIVGTNTAVYNTTIRGNSYIDGCIYTPGDFTISGGGNPRNNNVNGGIWAGGSANLGANAQIVYNSTYMTAIQNLGVWSDTEKTWKELEDIYPLNP